MIIIRMVVVVSRCRMMILFAWRVVGGTLVARVKAARASLGAVWIVPAGRG